jgi:hypothetical protein
MCTGSCSQWRFVGVWAKSKSINSCKSFEATSDMAAIEKWMVGARDRYRCVCLHVANTYPVGIGRARACEGSEGESSESVMA